MQQMENHKHEIPEMPLMNNERTQMPERLRWRIAQFFELQWWKSHLRGKEKQQYLSGKRKYWNTVLKIIERIQVLPKSGKVLDAGCGPSGIYMVLHDYVVEAVDPLVDFYESNLEFFDRSDYPWTNFINGALETVPLSSDYDLVFSMNAINHVADLDLCLDRLIGSLRSGGLLIITVDVHNYFVLKHIFNAIKGDILHPHQYTKEEYGHMLSKRNCVLIEAERLKHELVFDHYLFIARKV